MTLTPFTWPNLRDDRDISMMREAFVWWEREKATLEHLNSFCEAFERFYDEKAFWDVLHVILLEIFTLWHGSLLCKEGIISLT